MFLKAFSMGAKAVGGGRFYLFALAAAGQDGVERAFRTNEAGNRKRYEANGCIKNFRLRQTS